MTTVHRWLMPSRRSGSGPDALLLALGSVLLCYVWRLHQLFPILGALQLPLLSVTVAVGLYILQRDRRRRLEGINSPLFWILAGLCGVIVLGAPFALVQGSVFTFFVKDFLPNAVLLTALTAASVRSEDDLRWLVGVHILGAVIYSLVVLTRFSVGASGRLGGLIYYDSNGLGMLLVMTFPFALYFLLQGRDLRTRLLSAGSLLLFVVMVVKTGSRGAFVGFAFVGGWILLRYSSISIGRRLAALAAAVVVLGVWGSDQYWNQMSTLLTPTQDYNWAGNSESGRIAVWKRGVGYIADRPLTGVGPRNFNVAEGTLSRLGRINQLGGPGFKWSAAHNSFIQIGAELGLLGLALFLALLYKGYRIAGRPPPDDIRGEVRRRAEGLRQAFRTSLVGFAVTGFFLSSAYDPYLYAILGLIAGLYKLDQMAGGEEASAGAGETKQANRVAYRLIRREERPRAS